MNDISISVDNSTIAERPSASNRSDEDLIDIIPYNRETDHTTDPNINTSDEIQ